MQNIQQGTPKNQAVGFETRKAGKEIAPISREPGKVPSQVPSADLEKKFYHFHRLWNRRAA